MEARVVFEKGRFVEGEVLFLYLTLSLSLLSFSLLTLHHALTNLPSCNNVHSLQTLISVHFSPPHSLYIPPSLLSSPYYCTHHLLLFLDPHNITTSISLKHLSSYKSHSRLNCFSLLLILTSWDIVPNPGPSPSNSHPQN